MYHAYMLTNYGSMGHQTLKSYPSVQEDMKKTNREIINKTLNTARNTIDIMQIVINHVGLFICIYRM